MILKPSAEIIQQALQLLCKELGVVNAVRFLRQFAPGSGNYTQERDVLFAGKSLQEVVREIEKTRARTTTP